MIWKKRIISVSLDTMIDKHIGEKGSLKRKKFDKKLEDSLTSHDVEQIVKYQELIYLNNGYLF